LVFEIGQVIIDSQPLTVAVLASLLFGESLGPIAIVGLGLGVVGLVLLEVPLHLLGLHYSQTHPQVHLLYDSSPSLQPNI
jgi:drug/metabolite transporter (DMT)-like permease